METEVKMRNETIKLVLLSANFLMTVFALISGGARNYATRLINIDTTKQPLSQPTFIMVRNKINEIKELERSLGLIL